MLRRALVALVLLVSLIPLPARAQPACEFKLGFKALHDLIPDKVGECVRDEAHNPENGDGLQVTVAWHKHGGLLVWRKADNWTAFTDGATTWINGPFGVESRPNEGPCFSWEVCTPAAAAPAAPPTTPPAPPATATPVARPLSPPPAPPRRPGY